MSATPFEVPANAAEAAWVRDRLAAFRFFKEPGIAGWKHGANRGAPRLPARAVCATKLVLADVRAFVAGL